jgi:thiol-disulfide isomerase/thioredoxin
MLCQSNCPDLQEKYHSVIVPALAKLITDQGENLRVRIHSISCLLNFMKGLVNEEEDNDEVDDYSDVIKPYSKDLLALLASSFEQSLKLNNKNMQEMTLACISMIATILDAEFEPYYNDIIPFLRDLLVKLIQSRNNDNKELIAEIIGTISFICSSINKNPEKYMKDFCQFCDMFMELLTKVKEEDPEVIAIFKAFSHISTSMKTEFYPYLEKLFPILQNYAEANIDIKLEDIDLEKVTGGENTNSTSAPGLVLNTEGVNKKLSLKTFTLQNKVMAVDVLKDIKPSTKLMVTV